LDVNKSSGYLKATTGGTSKAYLGLVKSLGLHPSLISETKL